MSSKKIKLSAEKVCLIEDAIIYCEENDKSTEFMIQYIQDKAGIDFDTTIEYLKTGSKVEIIK